MPQADQVTQAARARGYLRSGAGAVLTPANCPDRDGAQQVLRRVGGWFPKLRRLPEVRLHTIASSLASQVNPGFGTGLGAFIVPHQAAMAHEPAKSALDNPPARQHRKTGGRIRTLDDFSCSLGQLRVYPLAEGLSRVATYQPIMSTPAYNQTFRLAGNNFSHSQRKKAAGFSSDTKHQPERMICVCTSESRHSESRRWLPPPGSAWAANNSAAADFS